MFVSNEFSGDDRCHGPAFQLPAEKRAVLRLARRIFRRENPLGLRIKHRHVRIRANGQRALVQIQQPRRIHREFGNHVRQRSPFRVDKLHQRKRQFGFQPGDAKRRVIKLDFLFVIAMRRMVAAQDFNRAVRQPFENRLAVARRAQRRVHLEIRVVFRPFGKRRLMRGAECLKRLAVVGPEFFASGHCRSR